VAVLMNPLNVSDALIREQIHGAAYTAGVKVVPVEATNAGQIATGFGAMTRARGRTDRGGGRLIRRTAGRDRDACG
jgi:hypothetical protein